LEITKNNMVRKPFIVAFLSSEINQYKFGLFQIIDG
jgi:hypothetical protein